MRVDRALARLVAVVLPFVVLGASACSFDVDKLFERDDPQVERARRALEASVAGEDADLGQARLDLEEVLELRCESDGGRDRVIERPGAALDLGLVLFRIAELVGNRFGDEEADAGSAEGDELLLAARARELDCAQLFLRKLAADPTTPPSLVLRARYLLGNFAFLARRYKEAIARYDEVLVQHPARGQDPGGPNADAGVPEDDDAVARAAAWNRAIALKRLQDQENDAGPDADDAQPDGGDDAAEDAGDDGGPDADDAQPDGGDDSGNDAGDDTGNDAGDDTGNDAGGDAGEDTATPQGDDGGANDAAPNDGADAGREDASAEPDAGAPPTAPTTPPPAPSSSVGVDLRELDRFDKKAPLDLDFLNREKIRKKIPKAFDK